MTKFSKGDTVEYTSAITGNKYRIILDDRDASLYNRKEELKKYRTKHCRLILMEKTY